VLRLAQDGKTTERVDVTLGSTQGDWVHVAQGLTRTDRVVLAGATHLPPGTAIQPVTPQGSQP
jgi:multidrug efflux pump subunit AcrA (membrane-fusion protein)